MCDYRWLESGKTGLNFQPMGRDEKMLPFATVVVAQNRLQNLSDDFIESALYGAFHILSF